MSYDGLLINTCYLKNKTVGPWSETTETITGPYPCRIEYGHRQAVNAQGQVVLSTATVFFRPSIMTTPGIVPASTLVVIDGVDHSVLQVDQPQDGTKVHHVEVLIQ